MTVKDLEFQTRMSADSFTEYREIITKAPYCKHRCICECILIKLDYTYNRQADTWTSQDKRIVVSFDFSGLLTANVRYSPTSITQICDQIERPLIFLSQFLDLVTDR